MAVRVAVVRQVARSWGTYVLAHCHTSPAIEVALDAGVRSIEHGSILTPETARRMAREGAYLVPTLQALEMLATYPQRWSLTPDKVARLRAIADAASASVRIADEAGVRVASGSDVVGPWQGRRGEEVVLKARILGAHKAIQSATRVNAELFALADEIGTVEVGKLADVILVAGSPLDRVELLGDPAAIPLVLRAGLVAKDSQGRGRGAPAGLARGVSPVGFPRLDELGVLPTTTGPDAVSPP